MGFLFSFSKHFGWSKWWCEGSKTVWGGGFRPPYCFRPSRLSPSAPILLSTLWGRRWQPRGVLLYVCVCVCVYEYIGGYLNRFWREAWNGMTVRSIKGKEIQCVWMYVQSAYMCVYMCVHTQTCSACMCVHVYTMCVHVYTMCVHAHAGHLYGAYILE